MLSRKLSTKVRVYLKQFTSKNIRNKQKGSIYKLKVIFKQVNQARTMRNINISTVPITNNYYFLLNKYYLLF